jgi:antitoxin (DNA-binding transcriptional repressor) of toxin-antitoxin stability system
MQQIEISDLQNQIGILVNAINQGEEVVFTKATQPIAKVINLLPGKKHRKAGSAAGQIVMAPDFDEPLDDFKEYME